MNSNRELTPEFVEFHATCARKSSGLAGQCKQLDLAFHSATYVLLSRVEAPETANLLNIVEIATNLLTIFLLEQDKWKGLDALHPEAMALLRPSLALLDPAVKGQWLLRGRQSSLREIHRAIMFLGAIYSSLSWIAKSPPEVLLDKDTDWTRRIFNLIPREGML